MTTWLLLVLTCVGAWQGFRWPTLQEELRKHGIDGSDFDDATRQITSFKVANEATWFGIAYYWYGGTDALPNELRVRLLDRRAKRWRHTVLDAEKLQGGSAVGLSRAGEWLYLDLHINPSAGALIVLSDDLRVLRRLYGWSSLLLPDGRVVYENSMVHFAPFHAASVNLYDPRTDRDLRLYPSPHESRDALIASPRDRAVIAVRTSGKDRLEILVEEQDLRWSANDRTEPVGDKRRLTVNCVLVPRPRCTVPRMP